MLKNCLKIIFLSNRFIFNSCLKKRFTLEYFDKTHCANKIFWYSMNVFLKNLTWLTWFNLLYFQSSIQFPNIAFWNVNVSFLRYILERIQFFWSSGNPGITNMIGNINTKYLGYLKKIQLSNWNFMEISARRLTLTLLAFLKL